MSMNQEDIRAIMELLIWKNVYLPYRWGGDDPMAGFDCSGGVLEIYRSVGIMPAKSDYNAQAIHQYLLRYKGQPLHPADHILLLGDAIFYGPSAINIEHVAMAMNDDLVFEFGGGGSKTTSEDMAINQNAYGRVRPLTARTDIVNVIRPFVLVP